MDRQGDASTGFIMEKWSCRGGPQQLTNWGIYEMGGQVPGRSLGGIFLSGPLTLLR
jgi:hypothetical protein